MLAPFLFIIVIDYITRASEGNYGYMTHRGSNQHTGRVLRNTAHKQERKVADLDFADDIALLESEVSRSQKQLETYSANAEKVGLITHEEKTVYMVRNNDPDVKLTLSGRELNKVKDFKYLGSYVGSTEK